MVIYRRASARRRPFKKLVKSASTWVSAGLRPTEGQIMPLPSILRDHSFKRLVQHSADATNNFVELKKVSTYMQGSFVEKGGWATSPGSDKANSAVAQACATMLGNLK
jgi:hypothetical protein